MVFETSDGVTALFLLEKAQPPAALTGLREHVGGLNKRFVGNRTVETKVPFPATVSWPRTVGVFPSEPRIVGVQIVPEASAA
jgi:hypothetical protein